MLPFILKMKEPSSLRMPVELAGTTFLLKVDHNECRIQMSRIYYSVYYRAFYIFIIVLALGCLLWMIVNYASFPNDWWFYSAEFLISFLISGDLFWRGYITGFCAFLAERENQLDCFVSLLCAAMIVFGMLLHGVLQELDEDTALVMAVSRTCVQAVRILILLKNMKNTETSIIELDDISERHDPPVSTSEQLIQLKELHPGLSRAEPRSVLEFPDEE